MHEVSPDAGNESGRGGYGIHCFQDAAKLPASIPFRPDSVSGHKPAGLCWPVKRVWLLFDDGLVLRTRGNPREGFPTLPLVFSILQNSLVALESDVSRDKRLPLLPRNNPVDGGSAHFSCFPERDAPIPSNIAAIAASCAHLSTTGHFASVAVAGAEEAFDIIDDVPVLPIWRGHGIKVRFKGLAALTNTP